jgi:uncharacterized protein
MARNLVSENWAYDISKNVITKGEITDVEVISQSIEMILSTYFGERIFNPLFGSSLTSLIFEGYSNSRAQTLADEILTAIERIEDRIVVDKGNSEFIFDDDTGVLEITIPYVIVREKIQSYFNKRIVF